MELMEIWGGENRNCQAIMNDVGNKEENMRQIQTLGWQTSKHSKK